MADDATTPTTEPQAAPPPAVAPATAPEAANPAPTAPAAENPTTQTEPEVDWTDPEARAEYLTKREGEAIARVKDELRAEQERAAADQRRREEAQAQAKSDMDWAADLDKRLDSDDPEVRQQARAERDEHRDRYNRGLALSYQHTNDERWQKFYTGRIDAQYADFSQHYPEVAASLNADPAAVRAGLEAAGGNYLRFMFEQGSKHGDAQGYARGVEETERKYRVEENAGGAPSNPNVDTPSAASAAFSGIDRSRPGAGLAMMRAADRVR